MIKKLEFAGKMEIKVGTSFDPKEGLILTVQIRTRATPSMIAELCALQSDPHPLQVRIISQQAGMNMLPEGASEGASPESQNEGA